MKIIENTKVKASLYGQCSVVLEASASELTQGGYGGPIQEGNSSLRLWRR